MIFIEKIPASERPQFQSAMTAMCGRLGIAANHIMAVIYKETGGTFSPRAYNANGGATGLIQFMPKTAAWLGTSTAALYNMTATQQLYWVERYFTLLKAPGKLKDYTDVYLVVFFPIALGKPENWILQSSDLSPYKVAINNQVIDLNKDFKITVAEFRNYARAGMPATVLQALANEIKQNPITSSFSLLGLMAIAAGTFLFTRWLKKG